MSIDSTTIAPAGERLTFALMRQHLQKYFHLEKGLLHTLVDLVVRPGTMLRGYFSGTRRKDYTNPIAYMLMAAAASLLSYGLYREPFTKWIRAKAVADAASSASVGDGLLAELLPAYAENMTAAAQHTAVNGIAMAIPQAVLIWLAFRSPRFNLAESFAFALYSIGTYLFVSAATVGPLLYLTHAWDLAQSLSIPLQVAFAAWLGTGLFGRSLRTTIKLLVVLGLALATWMVLFSLTIGAYTFATLH